VIASLKEIGSVQQSSGSLFPLGPSKCLPQTSIHSFPRHAAPVSLQFKVISLFSFGSIVNLFHSSALIPNANSLSNKPQIRIADTRLGRPITAKPCPRIQLSAHGAPCQPRSRACCRQQSGQLSAEPCTPSCFPSSDWPAIPIRCSN